MRLFKPCSQGERHGTCHRRNVLACVQTTFPMESKEPTGLADDAARRRDESRQKQESAANYDASATRACHQRQDTVVRNQAERSQQAVQQSVDILELPADIFLPARCDIHTPPCCLLCKLLPRHLVTVPRFVMSRFCAEALLVLSQASKAAKTLVSRDALRAARRGLQLVVREPSRTPRCRHGFPSEGQLVYEFQRRGGTGHVHTAHSTVVLTLSEYYLRYVAKGSAFVDCYV